VTQRDVDNDNIPMSKGTIQFVDLAGSEKAGKTNMTDQLKYQEVVLIQNTLQTRARVLVSLAAGSKIVPYRESKLTKALFNTLTPTSHIMIILNLHPGEANFEETLSSLQFADRCRNVDLKRRVTIGGKGVGESAVVHDNFANSGSNDRYIKKLNQKITELQIKLDNTNKDYRNKLEKVKSLLGVDLDFDRLVAYPNSKDVQILKEFKTCTEENANLKATLREQDYRLEHIGDDYQGEKKEFYAKQNKLMTEIMKLKEQLKREQETRNVIQNSVEEKYRKQIQEMKEDMKKIVTNNNPILSEKIQAIQNLPPQAENKRRKSIDSFDSSKKSPEAQMKEDVNKLKGEYHNIADNLKTQYEHRLDVKNQELAKFQEEAQHQYCKKKDINKRLKQELLELHNTCSKQAAVIEKIESGSYSNGIRSFHIPQKDKPAPLARIRFPLLYKYLDKERVAALPKTKEELQNLERRKDDKAMNKTGDSKKTSEATSLNGSLVPKDFKEEELDLKVNTAKLPPADLKNYCDNLRFAYKKLKEREEELKKDANKFLELNVFGDINEIIRERDKYQKLYREEVKKYNESKVAIEAQKRLLSNSTQFTSTGKIRPLTGLPPNTTSPLHPSKSLIKLK
jgi:myosin heavy subunit